MGPGDTLICAFGTNVSESRHSNQKSTNFDREFVDFLSPFTSFRRCAMLTTGKRQIGRENDRVEKITLQIMSREQCHELYKGWENNSAIYMDMSLFSRYQYDAAAVDRYYDAKQVPSRILFAIMKEGKPIGELQLKQIDLQKKACALSIHMQNDAVKGCGYGSAAERLALKYAFTVMGMVSVNADTVIKNTRSQHVLEKVGFKFLRGENGFRFYRCERCLSVCRVNGTP